MIKKLLMAAVAVSAIAATPAMAEVFQVTGTVAPQCSSITVSPIAFNTFTTGTDGTISGQSASSTPTDVWCNNAAATLSISSSGLMSSPSSATPTDTHFTKTLTFTPSATLGGSAIANNGSVGIKYASLVVTAGALTSSGKIPVAATDYAGTITVTLNPAG